MSNGQQFIQWLTDDKFAKVEPAEQMFDGKQDVVIPSSGQPLPMHLYGKAFIMLPDRNVALDAGALRQMYPKDSMHARRKGPAKSFEDYEKESRISSRQAASTEIIPEIISQEIQEEPAPIVQKKTRSGSFASNLLQKAKLKNQVLTIELNVELPTKQFCQFINDSFDDGTFDEIIESLCEKINKDELMNSVRDTIRQSLID